MKVTKTEEWQDAIIKHIKLLDENETKEFAHTLIFDLALWAGYNTYEMIGILECVKLELLETMNTVEEDD